MPLPIPARVPYTPVKLSATYNSRELLEATSALARSVPPMATITVVAAYTITAADDTVVVNTAGGNISVTLPQVAQVQFLKVSIVNIGANTATVVGTVSGAVNPTLAQWKGMTVQSTGTVWVKIADV